MTTWTTMRQLAALTTALAAGAVLLVLPPAVSSPPPPPVPASIAWPRAQAATLPVTLPDGTAYQPALFLDARTSVGTAPSADGRSLRLILRGADATIRPIRVLPATDQPSFGNVTAVDGILAWAEQTRSGRLDLWSTDLKRGTPARRLVIDAGRFLSDDPVRTVSIADGRLWWLTRGTGQGDVTQIRSVPLTGGAVDVRTAPGGWEWSPWPWMADGVGSPEGATTLRNLLTGESRAVRNPAERHTTRCSGSWCDLVVLGSDGTAEVRLMHPDGTGEQRVAGDTTRPAISEPALLDRFEVLWRTDPTAELTQNGQLLVHDLATGRTVQLSVAAATVSYGGGVLWWSNGGVTTTAWHSVDLRTVTTGGAA